MSQKIPLYYSLPAIILSALVATTIVLAWTEPSQAPTVGNAPAPLNVSSASQYKSGALGIGGLLRGYSNAIFDGNVGIGTTAPGAKLEVSEAGDTTIRIKPASGANNRVSNYDFWGTFYNYPADTAVRRVGNIQAGFATGTWGTEYMAFGLGSNDAAVLPTERMRITGAGNVGIGTTSPQSLLELRSTTNARLTINRAGAWGISPGDIKFNTNDAGTDYWTFGMQADSTNNMRLRHNSDEYLTVLTSGNVGIGTTSPSALLDIWQAGAGNVANFNNATGTALFVGNDGNVGIGTSTPSYTLDVDGTAALGTGAESMRIDTNGNVGIGTTTPNHSLTVGMVGDATSTYRLGVYGSARATGAFDALQTFDIAERFPIDPQCQIDDSCPEIGDLVSVKENLVIKKSSFSYDSKLIGIVSESPGFILSGGLDANSSRLVALAGRVPVKVSLENGLIEIGDALTSASSTPGKAMKATESGRVIGIALAPYGSEGIGKIMVFVNPHWYGGQLAADGSLAAESEQSGSTESGSLLDSFTQKVKQAMTSLGLFVENGIAQVKELVTDKLFAKKARIEKLEMVDQATGEIYCTWIENSEWQKVKGECDQINGQNPPSSGQPSENETPPAAPPETPPAEQPSAEQPTEQPPAEQPAETSPTVEPTPTETPAPVETPAPTETPALITNSETTTP